MKINILAMILILFISNLCEAQTISNKGIVAGISFSDWHGKDADEFADNFSYKGC